METVSTCTPIKSYKDGIVIPDTQLCAACSTKPNINEFYYVIHHNGAKGAAYQTFIDFFKCSLATTLLNNGSYLCRSCKRAMDKHQSYVKQAFTLKTEILSKCQDFIQAVRQKRQSPDSPPKNTETPTCIYNSATRINSTLTSDINTHQRPKKKKLVFSPTPSQTPGSQDALISKP